MITYRIELMKNARVKTYDAVIMTIRAESDKNAIAFGKEAMKRTKSFFLFVRRRRFLFSWRTIYRGTRA